MVENSQGAAAEEEQPPAAPPPAPRRPGHRGMDPRETVAELTAKAHEISQSAGSKVGAAMKNVIGAAAGLTGFAVESARDLIQYMVRRGQMTQIEGDKLLREVEAAHGTKSSPRSERSPAASAPAATAKPAEKKAAPEKAARPAKKAPAPEKQAAAKTPAKTPAKKPAAKAAKKPAAKGAAKTASKSTASTASTSRTKPAAKAPTTRKKK